MGVSSSRDAARAGSPAGSPVMYRIRSASRALLAELSAASTVRNDGEGIVNVQLRPEVGLRWSVEGCLRLVTPRDPVGRTLDEALDAGWARIVEARPRRRRGAPADGHAGGRASPAVPRVPLLLAHVSARGGTIRPGPGGCGMPGSWSRSA